MKKFSKVITWSEVLSKGLFLSSTEMKSLSIYWLNIGWFYTSPKKEFQSIKDYISFYASKADQCIVNGELVQKQDGEFYGGWITDNLTGPFKGAHGTSFW